MVGQGAWSCWLGPQAPLAPKAEAAAQSAWEILVFSQADLVTPDRDKGAELSIYC